MPSDPREHDEYISNKIVNQDAEFSRKKTTQPAAKRQLQE